MNLHENHRARLDKKVREFGLEMLEPHEQLEYILYAVIPRGDTNATAHRILERFGTLGAALNADAMALAEVEGVGPRTAKFLTSLPPLLGIVERSIKDTPPPRLSTLDERVDFAKTYFYGLLVEAAYLFNLNSSYRLLSVRKISDGVNGETHIFPQQVAKYALLDNASIVFVAHNHPCGNLNPSHNDIEASKGLKETLAAAGIILADSLIFSGDKYFSILGKGYLEKISLKYK